jgi:hypothetical protein
VPYQKPAAAADIIQEFRKISTTDGLPKRKSVHD